MNRANPILFLLLIHLLSIASAAPPDRPKGERLNIVLILADDLGIHDLACYRDRGYPTPRLDALAQQGVRFTQALVAQPICSASRAALLTGKHPARLHLTTYLTGRPDAKSQKVLQPVCEGQLPLEEITLAEVLSSAGYATGMFGKWHLGGDGFGPKEQGFKVAHIFPENSTPTAEEGSKNQFAITHAAETFIETHRNEPFFCYIAHHAPHIPVNADAARLKKHAQTFHPAYAATVEVLDQAVGSLLDKIDALELTDRTIVVFSSDNGGLHVLEAPGTPATDQQPYRAGKGFLYEGGLRVPLLVRSPGIKPGTDDRPILLTDLMPTLLRLVGIVPERTVGPLDGIALDWKSQPHPTDRERPLYWHFPHYTNQGGRPASALRLGNKKLIEQLEDGSTELYDLAVDPGEEHNLARETPELARSMAEQLHDWQRRIGADSTKPNPEFDPALHRALYVDPDPSRLRAKATAQATGVDWLEWRKAMNQVVKGKKPTVTPALGDIRLFARDAVVHAQTMRYEREPFKNVLGYWTNPKDWAEWRSTVPKSGRYEVEVQYGCGAGSGGAQVKLLVNGQPLEWTVVETGHFQNMIQITIGIVDLPAGPLQVEVRPTTKPGPAVMDLRRVVLRPVNPSES